MPNSYVDDEQIGKKGKTGADVADDDLEEAKRLASERDIIHRKIQLWANNEENEYAIRVLLDGDPKYEMREKEGRKKTIHSINESQRTIYSSYSGNG